MNHSTTKIIIVSILLLMFLGSLFLIPKVHSENGTEEGEESEGAEDFGKGLGVLAVALGFIFNILFVFQKFLRSSGVKLPIKSIWVLRFHFVTNILLGLAGMYHGYLYINRASFVEYFLVGLILLIIFSGLVLRYAKNRKLKVFAKLIHAQRIISILILILVGIHMVVVED